MPDIRVLDKATVSKIAAGEVIERPASVVKELVENSIDAGASDIRVRIQGAGRELIEVIDNGHGMDPENLKRAFIQHSTSKLSTIDDLEELGTMGFRGEALSSIASVAAVEVSTKEQGASIAHFMSLKGGSMSELSQVGRDNGTTISVIGLFSGHPARLKYLKSDRVEMGHIIKVVTERALANPKIAFRLVNDGLEVINVPRARDLPERINDMLGRKVAKELVSFTEVGDGMTIIGHLAKPTVTKASRDELFIFINGRPVTSSKISAAIESGYAGMLMKHRHPVGVVIIKLDPRSLDVNVHPTKRKVRFANERKVARFIEMTVAQALGNTEIIPEAEPVQKEIMPKQAGTLPASRPAKGPEKASASALQSQLLEQPEAIEVEGGGSLPRMKVIGQILDTYILAQSGSDLLIIDQHAAHERINLDRLQKSGKKVGQTLITPVPLDLSRKESQLVEHYRPVIEELGFKIEPFGKDTWLVRGVPAIGGHLETEQGLRDLVEELVELGKARSIHEKKDEILHLAACHSSIRANETLSMKRMARLVEELQEVDNPFHCAHGRPIIIRMTQRELEKLFKRVV